MNMNQYDMKHLFKLIEEEKIAEKLKRQEIYAENHTFVNQKSKEWHEKRKEKAANDPELQDAIRKTNRENFNRWRKIPQNRAVHNARNSKCQKKRRAKAKENKATDDAKKQFIMLLKKTKG